MTYLDYILLFNQYDREQRFSDGATRMYVKLLDVANTVRVNSGQLASGFQRSDGYMESVCGWSTNTLKKHRTELASRGLLSGDWGQAGRNSSGKYQLLHPAAIVSDVDTISQSNVSTSDTIPPLNLSDVDTISPENALNVSGNVSNVDTLYKEIEKESIGAALAASFTSSSSKKPPAKNSKKSGAVAEEIAGLELPHQGTEFAHLWAMFLTSSKQQGKSLNAHRMALTKLGRKPEAFALVMLEAAIQGDWSGVENPGTARAFAEWQAQQSNGPAASPATSPAEPELNHELLAEQQAAEAAARTARFNHYAEA